MKEKQFNRRTTDIADQAEIENMISQENEPKSRVMLMLINRLNINLMEVTDLMCQYGSKLDGHIDNFQVQQEALTQHIKDEDALINKGKGLWLLVPGLLGVSQVILGWMLVTALQELRILHAMDDALNDRITIMEHAK